MKLQYLVCDTSNMILLTHLCHSAKEELQDATQSGDISGGSAKMTLAAFHKTLSCFVLDPLEELLSEGCMSVVYDAGFRRAHEVVRDVDNDIPDVEVVVDGPSLVDFTQSLDHFEPYECHVPVRQLAALDDVEQRVRPLVGH